jgi:hypothetical protein
MQIDSIASTLASTIQTGSFAVLTQVTANGKAQSAVVEHTAAGYEAYLSDQPGPVATGSSIAIAESRLDSSVQFQA